MIKKKIVIVGGGFAGIAAVKYLSRFKNTVEVILIDQYENSHFRPLMPDVISHIVSAQNLLFPFLHLKERYGFTFYCEQVKEIDFSNNSIVLSGHKLFYDILILTAGSQTAFPPNGVFKQFALRLDTVHDANLIRDTVLNGKFKRFVVCGGGYTGVELASNLRRLITNMRGDGEVLLVEMVDKLVSTLPDWMQRYITKNLSDMGVQIRTSTKVDTLSEGEVILSSGEHLDNAFCIWTTGLVGPELTRNLDVEKMQKGRIKVDTTMRFKENCFAAGDVACVEFGGECSRMSVQLSIEQGLLAAENAISLVKNRSLGSYIQFDPGYIIPMANGISCGEAFGIRLKGRIATWLHYLLSTYRSYGVVNRFEVIRAMTRVSSNKIFMK